MSGSENLGVEDPVAYLRGRLHSNRFKVLMMSGIEHGSRRGHLEQSALTGEIRDRFFFDFKWTCDTCRVYKERSEGARLVTGFEGHEMWVTVAQESNRETLVARAQQANSQFAVVPIGVQVVLLATGPIDGLTSERVEDPPVFVEFTLMPQRWEGRLSSSRGFLPPARQYDYHEIYHKDTGRRCWHLHGTQEEARACTVPTVLDGLTAQGWYVRGTSEWKTVGSVDIKDDGVAELLDELRIRWTGTDSLIAAMTLEPMEWKDPRFEEFRQRAGWRPPRPDFQVPPIAITIKIDHRRMTGTG